jgi:hypothetical protein
MRRIAARGRLLAVVALSTTIAAGLTACAGGPPMPTPTPDAVSPSPGATGPSEPEIDLAGTATENQPFFDQVNIATVDAGGRDGRSFIDALVAAGYSKELMELTPDRTSINAQVDNFQFSVRLNGTCLIGQHGAAGYASYAGPVLADGHCLVGTTRPIDW